MIAAISSYFSYVLLGLLPSIIWLLFYLRKDRHPEPKNIIFFVFLGGAFMGPIAILLQYLALWFFKPSADLIGVVSLLNERPYLFLLNIIIFAPLTEEFLKYLVVRWQVLRDPAFDEPVDAMIYMIVSALGFAAVENLLNIFLTHDVNFSLAVSQSLARFLSATLLHTLSSGILGYFLARSILNLKRRGLILGTGFLLAFGFHSLYNYLAWLLKFNKIFVVVLAFFLITIATIISWEFSILKKQKAICKLN